MKSRRIRQQAIPLAAGLHERASESLFIPGNVRLAAKKRRDGDQPALQLAAFEGDVDIAGALIAGNDGGLGAEHVVEELGNMIGDRSGARGTAFWRLATLAHIVDGFIRTVAAHDK